MRSNKPGTAIDTNPSISSPSIAEIVRSINQVDDGLSALIDLLAKADQPVSAGGIAALMRPHADLLRRASAALNDAT
jgi:hypothetical protein